MGSNGQSGIMPRQNSTRHPTMRALEPSLAKCSSLVTHLTKKTRYSNAEQGSASSAGWVVSAACLSPYCCCSFYVLYWKKSIDSFTKYKWHGTLGLKKEDFLILLCNFICSRLISVHSLAGLLACVFQELLQPDLTAFLYCGPSLWHLAQKIPAFLLSAPFSLNLPLAPPVSKGAWAVIRNERSLFSRCVPFRPCICVLFLGMSVLSHQLLYVPLRPCVYAFFFRVIKTH